MPGELIRKNLWRIFRHRAVYFLKRVLKNFYKLRTYYYLKGTFAAFIRLPATLKIRKEVQTRRRVSLEYLVSIMDKDFV